MFSAHKSSRKKLKMAKNPSWVRSLSEVLGYQTTTINRKSERTGNIYQVDVIPRLEAVAMGAPEEQIRDDGRKTYRYSIFDMSKNLEYKVSCPQFLKISGLKQVILVNLCGGALQNGRGWYKADSIAFANVKK